MSVYAAKCPCCGRDIGFDGEAAECTCIFCGAKLLTSALKKELVDPPKEEKAEKAPEPAPPKEEKAEGEPELTEEELRLELDRKAEYKSELHRVLKQIDELRARRPGYKSQLKTAGGTLIAGAVMIAAAPVLLFTLYDPEKGFTGSLVTGACVAGLVGVFVLAISLVRRRDIRNQQGKLESMIRDKKDKRDVLIGRLNKINKKLHIHHDHE
ncbi:MAG: hypothetical protein J5772_05020 [Clostridia bacterium]|nr:hypothetical protein [Clostridia bacterium]